METAAKVIVVALLIALLWYALQPHYVFKIDIAGSVPRVAKGEVSPAFLSEVGAICSEFGVTRGWIGGVRRGRSIALAFSHSVPPPCRQRLRNVWAL